MERFMASRRRRSVMLGIALCIVTVVAVAACGADEVDVGAATPASTPTASQPTSQTSLEIAIQADEGAAAQEWTLTCDPPGGTHPDPAAACAALAGLDVGVLAPVAPDQMCTQIYAGPETATLRGTWNGTPVDASFSRNNGCEIARWDAVAGLLPTVGATPS